MTTEATTAVVQHPAFALLPPIFRDCVAPEIKRYSLTLPFVRGDWVYATDACVIVRVPATPEIAALLPTGDRRLPKVEPYFDDATEYAPESIAVAVDEPPPCRACDGKRRLPERECAECEGEGETECPRCGQDEECPACDGKGVIPAGSCRDCSGTGYDVDSDCGDTGSTHAVAFANGTTLGQKYAWLLERHGARVFLPVRRQTREVTDPVKIEAPGGVVGFVMPLSPTRIRP